MHETTKQIMAPFSTNNYSVAQRDDFSFVIVPKDKPSEYLVIFEAEEVKPLCDDLILVRRNFFSHWCVYSVPKKDYISLPIYNNIKAEGKYFIFERNKKFGIAVIAYGKFFEVNPPEYTCIIGITHGCIVFQEKSMYGVHSIFSKETIIIKEPIRITEKGNIMVNDCAIKDFLNFAHAHSSLNDYVISKPPFAMFCNKISHKTSIYYTPLSLKVYRCDHKLDIPGNEIEDFLIEKLTK